MNNRIRKIFHSNDLQEIKQNLKCFLKETDKKNDKEIIQIYKKAEKELSDLRSKNEIVKDSIYVYSGNDAIKAMLAEEIVNCEDKRPIKEILKIMLEDYLEKYKQIDNIEKKITKVSIENILEDMERQYKLVSIIEKSGIKVSIMLFDVISQYKYHFVEYNTHGNGDIAIHKYLYEAKDFETVFSFIKQIGILVKYLLVGHSKKVPDSFINLCNQIKNLPKIDYETEEGITVFSELFVSMFFRKMDREEKNSKIPKDKQTDMVEAYFDNCLNELYQKLAT